jgi:DNA-binding transcriptional LysR family regulator
VNPELRHVRAFVVLAEELNFTRAAARLHIAQQGLSKQIRQLEDLLGVTLFVRTTRTVRLTAAGVQLLEAAPEVINAADAMFDAVRDRAQGRAGRLQLGLLSTAAMDLTTEILRQFNVERPNVRITLRNYRLSDDRSGGVRQRETDVSIVLLPFHSQGLALEPLYDDPRVALLAATHPLADRRELRAADVAAEPFVMVVGRDPIATDYWTLAAYRDGPPIVGVEINDLDEYYAAIRAGQAVAAPTVSMTRAFGWADLVVRRLTDVPPAQVALCWRPEADDPIRDDFIRVARAVARSARRSIDR